MALAIKNNSFLETCQLKLYGDGIHLTRSIGFGGKKRLRFSEVDCVLMSADYRLSIQYGTEVFVIQTRPQSAKHAKVIQTLVECLRQSRGLA
jgi:hypothetical protein